MENLAELDETQMLSNVQLAHEQVVSAENVYVAHISHVWESVPLIS